MKFDIKSRWDNSVVFAAEIVATENTPFSIRLGLAVKAAWKVRAYLHGANLGGADLYGANLGGLILLPARATRSDGYEYFAWTSVLGGMVIKAGCREWVGEDAIAQARRHCETETSPAYRAEALRIVAHIEAAWNEHQGAINAH
jgi:hypothetical protein